MPKLCPDCGLPVPTNGHASGGEACLTEQLRREQGRSRRLAAYLSSALQHLPADKREAATATLKVAGFAVFAEEPNDAR
jgi:hypothetical protein